jgi:hypothetical protein
MACHSIAPAPSANGLLRVLVGGADCRQPYDVSLLDISAMSVGALGANAISRIEHRAKKGDLPMTRAKAGSPSTIANLAATLSGKSDFR